MTASLLASLCVAVFAWLAALMHERGIRPVAKLHGLFMGQPMAGRVFLGAFFTAMWLIAGTKPDGGAECHPYTSLQTRVGVVDGKADGANLAHDFSAPPGATVCADWEAFGASEDWMYVSFTDWALRVGDRTSRHLRVHSDGWVEAFSECDAGEAASVLAVFAPLKTSLGVVPRANWPLLPEANRPSRLWSLVSPSNTLLLTWQNALLGRRTDTPVSFQAEIGQGGSADFRYCLSAVPDGISLPAASACGITSALDRSASHLRFESALDRRCADSLENFLNGLGGLDPLSIPPGTTNTALEQVFYSGRVGEAVTIPEPTDSSAVLLVTASGSGMGVLDVGGVAVPLVAGGASSARSSSPPSPPLHLAVPRGRRVPLYLYGDGSLTVSLSSGDFAFGVLPDPAGGTLTGWVNFPAVRPTPACIHNYATRSVTVTLPASDGAEDLTCTWAGASGVAALNAPPRSATLVAGFSPREEGRASYSLSHPLRLFGAADGSQTVRFCPVPPGLKPDGQDPYDPPPGGGPDDPDDPDDDDCDEDDDSDPDETGQSGDGEESGNGQDGGQPPKPCRCDRESCDGSCACCGPVCCGLVDPDEYENARTNLAHMAGVLLVRDPPLFGKPIRLELPDGEPNCCPCADHANRRVELVVKSGLKVIGPDGADFARSVETVDVRIAAAAPSRLSGDAFASFATNGAVTLECAHTALGVGIDSPCADLDALEALNPSFGLPAPVCTNAADAVALTLATDVLLGGMNVHVGFEGADAPFALWIPCGGGWERVASSDGGALDVTLPAWRTAVGAGPRDGALRTEVRVTAAAPGTATLVFRAWGAVDGTFVEDEARRRITAVAPCLRADIDHDGRLGEQDDTCRLAGRPFRFWFNENCEKGDHVGQSDDLSPNAADLKVNGKLDLVNLFPVSVDVSPFVQAWGGAAEMRLRSDSDALRYCVIGDGFSLDALCGLVASPILVADGTLLESAGLMPLGREGVTFGDLSPTSLGSLFLAFEAAKPVGIHGGPEIVITLGGVVVYRESLPIEISSVDEMYRWVSLRGAEAGGTFSSVLPGEPLNLPDAETDGRHFVFVHGYNVTPDGARQWARAMFKRLWWAGSRSGFTAVNWRGDDSRISVPVMGDISPNYYVNVEHAFMAAEALKSVCTLLPGEKVMMAHSLGNVLVSAAAKDFGLRYAKYYMLNAAVPMEAYDEDASDDLMVDGVWKGLDPRFRASRFADLFASDCYDFRAGLSWKGRFAGIPDVVNCYSPTEDILMPPSVVKAFGMAIGETTGGAWSKQELFKGCAVWYGINSAAFSGTRIEGGWGINARYMANPLAYVPFVGFNAGYFSGCTREDLICSPLFTSFNDSRMSSTNTLKVVDCGLRAKMLGDAIPAESFAMGANATEGVDGNYDMQSETPNGWPRASNDWRHSDLKDISYYYVWKLFEKIARGE